MNNDTDGVPGTGPLSAEVAALQAALASERDANQRLRGELHALEQGLAAARAEVSQYKAAAENAAKDKADAEASQGKAVSDAVAAALLKHGARPEGVAGRATGGAAAASDKPLTGLARAQAAHRSQSWL